MRQDNHLSALHPGARLNSYTIGAILGAGGFGITYKAVEDITAREVAIKEYLPTAYAVRDPDGATVRPLSEGAARDFDWGLERFREEAKLLVGFRHTNIVPVLAYFEANGTGYLVMAFQEGTSLSEVLRTRGALSETEVLQFTLPLLDGVEEVHRRNFLHRDIKPDNIFIRNDGSPVLLDFGAARQALGEHSKNFTTLLTEGYAPFEQYAGTGNQGPWSDIYALAAVMFRSLTGKSPVEAPRRAVSKLRGTTDPMAADFSELRNRVSPDLAFAIEAAMRVVEQERPQSITAFRELIRSPGPAAAMHVSGAVAPGVTGTVPTSAATLIPDAAQLHLLRAPSRPPAAPRKSRHMVYFAAAAVVLVAAASGAAYVGDDRSWLPGAFKRAGPESAPPSTPAKAAVTEPARTPPSATRASDEGQRRAEEERKKAEEQARRADEEKRKAATQASDEERGRGFAEYQRLQLEQVEAERRQWEARRAAQPPRDPNAQPVPGSTTQSDERPRGDAERKRLEDEQSRRNATRSPPRTAPERAPQEPRTTDERRDDEGMPPEPREAAPAAPPALRRPPPPSDTRRTSPYPPPMPGSGPRGWQTDDDY